MYENCVNFEFHNDKVFIIIPMNFPQQGNFLFENE